MAHPNEQQLRDGYAAFQRGDLDALRNQFLAEDMVWHAGGNNQLSGDYRGVDEVLGLFGKNMELSGGTFRVEVHDVLANDGHAVVLGHVTADREGKRLDQNYVHVSHLRDGKLTESWIHNVDEAANDEFWGQ